MREFTKIKYDASKGLKLVWQTPVKGDDDDGGHYTSSFSSQQQPHEGFLNVLKALSPDIPVHCELPADWYKGRIAVTGVSLSYDDSGLSGASIQSKIGLHSGITIAINGPALKLSGEAHEMLEEECVFRLRNLVKEAEKVLKAVASKQAELFPVGIKATNGKPVKDSTPAKAPATDKAKDSTKPPATGKTPAKKTPEKEPATA